MRFPIHIDGLGAFVAELRNEGLDARTDLFNGQVGLVVGPNGLDPKRMPLNTAGLFFPLWELNYAPNRALVEGRHFHDIFESRPPDWKFNRPYQPSADQARLDLRHWNRSAALLGDKVLEGRIQKELIRRFPPNDFPVNIDVVGGQNQTYAVVQVTNFDAGIEEMAKACPEDGGKWVSVMATTEKLIAELQEAGRISVAPQARSSAPRAVSLALHPIGRAGSGSDLMMWDRVYQYEVRGLPFGEQAWIADFGSHSEGRWRVLRATNGVQSDWAGEYQSPEVALAELQREYE